MRRRRFLGSEPAGEIDRSGSCESSYAVLRHDRLHGRSEAWSEVRVGKCRAAGAWEEGELKYYRVEWIEGTVVPKLPNLRPLMWAEIDGDVLRYMTDDRLPPDTRRITRTPRMESDGFVVEIEEWGERAMARFTEYHGKKKRGSGADGAPFKKVS
jgi:hypothetical protein